MSHSRLELRIFRQRTKLFIGAALAAFGVAVGATQGTLAQSSSGDSAYGRYVDDKGNITRPTEFMTDWAHLGSWAVAKDGGVDGVHNVYTPKAEALYFREHGKFRDGAILVKEVRGAEGKDHTTGDAHWATDLQVWFVMVKDEKGRFDKNPLWGDGWGWALFKADDPAKQVATDYKADCLGCHVPVQKTDWIYEYAYPRHNGVAGK